MKIASIPLLLLIPAGLIGYSFCGSEPSVSTTRPQPVVWVTHPRPDRPDPMTLIIVHRWWTQKPSATEVQEWLTRITHLEVGQVLFLDNSGHTALGQAQQVNGSIVFSGYEGLGERCIGFYQDARRPFATLDVTQQFLLRIDNADY